MKHLSKEQIMYLHSMAIKKIGGLDGNKRIYLNNTEKEKLIKIRDNLLRKLMSGEIRVQINN